MKKQGVRSVLQSLGLARNFSGQSKALAAVSASLLIAFFVLLAGCGTEKESESLDSFDGLYNAYLSSCAECHRPQTELHDMNVVRLDMTSAEKAYASLSGYVNIRRINGCQNLKYVVPNVWQKSFLVAILDPSVNQEFAAVTGTGCAPLNHTLAYGGQADSPTPEVLAALKQWISSGAGR